MRTRFASAIEHRSQRTRFFGRCDVGAMKGRKVGSIFAAAIEPAEVAQRQRVPRRLARDGGRLRDVVAIERCRRCDAHRVADHNAKSQIGADLGHVLMDVRIREASDVGVTRHEDRVGFVGIGGVESALEDLE